METPRPRPIDLLNAISRHLDEYEVRIRQRELRDYDKSAIRWHLEAAQAKISGEFEALVGSI